MRREPKICLVLGGGGIRGLAHFGVLKVLERHAIPVDAIIGTSAGAIAAAIYATDPDAEAGAHKAIAYLGGEKFAHHAFKKILVQSASAPSFFGSVMGAIRKGYLFTSLVRKESILPRERLMDLIVELVPPVTFAETKIPFAVPALDILTGEELLIRDGSLVDACYASCALPGFFPPQRKGDAVLADAGVIGPVPVDSAEVFDPTLVIAVDITSHVKPVDAVTRGIDAMLRVDGMISQKLNRIALEKADIVIRPQVGNKEWSDITELEMLVEDGVLAAKAKIAEIEAAVQPKRRFGRGA